MSARPIHNLLQLLGLIERGDFAHACNEHLTKSLQTLSDQPKGEGKATITITLEIVSKKGLTNVTPKIASKLPEGQSFGSTPFWIVEDGLSTQHPNQLDMLEPREVRPARSEPATDRA
ncbi:hypothetical protein [Hansschlegelia zhihuaiae]|uniref:Uncharacterized protein n=1 Tax=Hansschlegelia zhihuaiae TaxID=405005 RepID=A0A4Q0MFU7_9HYPH|nr:hypothetical protein [Hansschlegelia zhihuaiae]RXF72083.1 hypothetical protein EK403_14840 [Hansschlegelia zhihuaiae]